MKIQKVIRVLVLFSIAMFAIGCGATSGSQTENTTDVNKRPSSDFPMAPSIIAKADFEMLDGQPFQLEKNKGKVVLFNLWATWCGPCRDEMPDLVKMQDEYRDQDFVIIGLDTDVEEDTPDKVKAFKSEMELNYRLGWSDQATTAEFFSLGQADAIPQSFLIDREGRLRAMFKGGGGSVIEKMKQKVKEIVNEK